MATQDDVTLAKLTLAARLTARPGTHRRAPRVQMPQTDQTTIVEQPTAPSQRVEGWVQYYEYFHKLNDDIQVSPDPRLPGSHRPECPPPCLLARVQSSSRAALSRSVQPRPSP